MPTEDPWLPERLLAEAVIVMGERMIEAAAAQALDRLRKHLTGIVNPDTGVLDTALIDSPEWLAAVDDLLLPVVGVVYADAWLHGAEDVVTTVLAAGFRDVLDRADLSPDPYVTEHLATVRNRMVRVSDDVFNQIRGELETGRLAGESIPHLAARVDGVLGEAGAEQWANRARTVARTETIGAYNAGLLKGTQETASAFGITPEQTVKEWVATGDDRVRETHAAADGQQVLSNATFTVGGYAMDHPGDPAGPGKEVINCRCTMIFLLPGDPGYPTDLEVEVPPGLLSQAALEAETNDWMAAGDFANARLLKLMAEMDRRDNFVPTTTLPAESTALADQAALEDLLFPSGLPVRDLTSRTVTAQAKRSADDLLFDEYQSWVYGQWLRAEEATRGTMMTPAALAKGYGIEDILTRRISQKWATPELQEWLAQSGNQPMTWADYRSYARADKKARQATWVRRNRGWESEYG